MTSPRNSISPQQYQSSPQNYYQPQQYQQQQSQSQQSFENFQMNSRQQQQQQQTSNGISNRRLASVDENYHSPIPQAYHQQQTRRVISFTSPKPPFDYQKQEQYYSNPSIVPKSRDDKFDEVNMKPIDLTKPRQNSTEQQVVSIPQPTVPPQPPQQLPQHKVSDVVGDLVSNESGLLKSLVLNTDKIRTTVSLPSSEASNSRLDENLLLQAYLTEQALKYTKIKQSQMNKSFSVVSIANSFGNSNTNLVVVSSGSSLISSSSTYVHMNTGNDSIQLQKDDSVESPGENSISAKTETDTEGDNCNSVTMMDVDSEIKRASPLISLTIENPTIRERHRSPKPDLVDGNDSNQINHYKTSLSYSSPSNQTETISHSPRHKIYHQTQIPNTDSAKNFTSESLKMTTSTEIHQIATKPRVSRTIIEESEESSSESQDVSLTGESGGSASGSNTTPKPPSDFTGILARTVIVGEDGLKSSSNEVQPMFPRVPLSDDGRPVCTICSKTFQKQHQMVLHMNIHYMERKFKCEPCAVSFRTQGLLQKHERSEGHKNKVMMTSTFGVPTTSNPRPFECPDCKVAFRIHGHLAKHLRSKTHVQKLECLQKLPFGTYAEIERAGISLTEIDTTDCDNSLTSLKILAQKLIEKDPTKLSAYATPSGMESANSGILSHESGSEDNNSPETPPSQMMDVNESLGGVSNGGSSTSTGENDTTPPPAIPPRPSSSESFSGGSSTSSNSASNGGCGIKRKFDSFSSCSDDSISNVTATITNQSQQHQHQQQQQKQQDSVVVEKRVRTSSETL